MSAVPASRDTNEAPRRPGPPDPRRWTPWRAVGCAALAAVLVWAFVGVGWSWPNDTWPIVLGAMWEGAVAPDLAFVWNGSGEDLVGLIGQTLAIAFLGTAIAVVGAVPLAFLAVSRRRASGRGRRPGPVSAGTGVVLTIVRTFPEIVLAVIFVKMVGPGPFAGALAIGVHSIGMLARLYAEEIERLSAGPEEAIAALGGTRAHVFAWGQLPRLLPPLCSLALNRFEIAVRSATILGIVGAGGIGTPIIFAISSRSWDRVAIIVIGIVVTVTIIDAVSSALRKKLQ
ncbi:phosphonate ABC transporter, permease protein PhnE [Pseudoclavibacter endophyticus]|uniref:Phosphonate ABC transporter, permease protein PhnE n=1 Tax=Pseudoclavibacter endophyticus TaxID=1778590 RepID=A0A6H9WKK3_9MICO|nr:phosphonate ABC transporter, permease protein PhnE [Pseudoclavibacter endophyticus]KAB1648289.1 phosphonate ABC transporter, permease protein PhnE [Pseudoclavibacter endophyticus]GGA71358.1 phosphonate ABC transporter, permease protein PhnE [Pseudoclavibacter endophyticus]